MQFCDIQVYKDVIVWGVRREGILLAMFLEENGIEVKGFCDNNKNVWHERIYKMKECISPDELNKDMLVYIGVQTEETEKEIIKQLDTLKIEYKKGMQNLVNQYWKTVDDEKYLKAMYFFHTNKELDIDNPKSFNEKLQWLKLYDRKLEYNILVDKYEVKKYVASLVGEQYIIPTLGIWNTFEEINFDDLPEQFALKCTHDSGSCVICENKSFFDINKARKKIEKCLHRNPYYTTREWPYKDVKPRIIAEKLLIDDFGEETPVDYKFFCFDGQPKVVLTVHGGHNDETKAVRRMYDIDWNLLDVGLHGKESVKEAETKPEKYNEMVELACKLSKGYIHVRVDFYCLKDSVYFGEITFYHMSGYEIFKPDSWNDRLGEYIKLPLKS